VTPQPPPGRILKRSGETAPFEIARIQTALRRAGQATRQFGDVEASVLAERVLTMIPAGPGITPNVEQVQDIVEQTLIAAGHLDTARAYIAYWRPASPAISAPRHPGAGWMATHWPGCTPIWPHCAPRPACRSFGPRDAGWIVFQTRERHCRRRAAEPPSTKRPGGNVPPGPMPVHR